MLNLVNNGGLWEEVFSIDEHELYIVGMRRVIFIDMKFNSDHSHFSCRR